jgi:glycosyltransferase involved in cell wall biosynthesis
MDAGCAIVTTNAEGCAEVVGDAGLVVPKGKPQGIREALEKLMHDPELVRDLAARARQRAASLTWPNIVGRYREVLQAAISRRSPASTRAVEVQAAATPHALR